MDPVTPPDSADVLETGEQQEQLEKFDDSKLRTIVVENLRHPGGWATNRLFQRLLNSACHFNVSFSRPVDSDERQVKTGRLEIVFSTTDSARDAYTSLQKMIVDGARPVTLVDPEFFSTPEANQNRTFFEISDDPRLVFLLDLPKSADEHMIAHFFGGEPPVHFSTLPMPSGENLLQAEVLMANSEVAGRILEGPAQFAMSDEDVECVVKLLSPREYSLYSKMDDVQKKPVSQNRVQPSESVSDVQLAPELDEDIIVARLMEVIDAKRLNWAEINEKHELYELCDLVSAAYNGVPDSILKPAMGVVLQRHLNRTTLHWQREHIEGLLRGWKIEMMSEQKFERSSFVPMETIDYRPIAEVEPKKERETADKSSGKRRTAAMTQLGVGAFLTANREKLKVETGDLELDSDDDGNVVIGGEALSFDSWARITKTKASGVVRANEDGTKKIGNGGLSKKQLRMARTVEGMDQEEWKKWRNEKSHARKHEMKQRIMQRGAMEEEVPVAEPVEEEEVVPEVPAKKPKVAKVLDEGEIDSDEEEATAAASGVKKRRPSDSSDSSSSSSSEEDPDGPVDARKRRKMRRKKDRKNPRVLASASQQASLNPEFRAMFENRKAIIAQMSPAHKAAFASALTQIAQNNASTTPANASQVISSMMSGFK